MLDEPTAVLTRGETQALFPSLRRLRDAGCAVIFISHKLDEIEDIADRVTVLRRGRVAGRSRRGDADARAGAPDARPRARRPCAHRPAPAARGRARRRCAARPLGARSARGEPAARASTSRCGPARSSASPASTATASASSRRCFAGVRRPTAGRIEMRGPRRGAGRARAARAPAWRTSPATASAAGLVPGFTVAENLMLKGSYDDRRCFRRGLWRRARGAGGGREAIRRFGDRAAAIPTATSRCSRAATRRSSRWRASSDRGPHVLRGREPDARSRRRIGALRPRAAAGAARGGRRRAADLDRARRGAGARRTASSRWCAGRLVPVPPAADAREPRRDPARRGGGVSGRLHRARPCAARRVARPGVAGAGRAGPRAGEPRSWRSSATRRGPRCARWPLGAFGSGAAWTATLLKATPLLLTGLAVALSLPLRRLEHRRRGAALRRCAPRHRGGDAAALPAAPAAGSVPPWCWPAPLGGALFGAVAGWLRAARGVSEVISTILLNFVAIQLVAWAVQGPLQEAAGAYPQSDALPGRAPCCRPSGACTWAAARRSCSPSRRARAASAPPIGLSPARGRSLAAWRRASPASRPSASGRSALTLAGALAGLAGAVEVAGVTGRLYEGLSPGTATPPSRSRCWRGCSPLAVVPSALFFGALEAGAGAMQREAGVPSVVTQIVQGLVDPALHRLRVRGPALRRRGRGAAAPAPSEAA